MTEERNPQQGEAPIEEDILLDHNYDGIQEYDNPMPAWWTWIFIGTVIWSGVYIVMIETGMILKYEERLERGMAEIRELQAAAAAAAVPVDDAFFAALERSEERLANGARQFATHCVACHAADGSGGIGLALNQNAEWRHGGSLVDIYEVTRDGVAAAGMPPWQAILSHDDMVDVSLHIETFGGVVASEMDAEEPSEAEAAEASDEDADGDSPDDGNDDNADEEVPDDGNDDNADDEVPGD